MPFSTQMFSIGTINNRAVEKALELIDSLDENSLNDAYMVIDTPVIGADGKLFINGYCLTAKCPWIEMFKHQDLLITDAVLYTDVFHRKSVIIEEMIPCNVICIQSPIYVFIFYVFVSVIYVVIDTENGTEDRGYVYFHDILNSRDLRELTNPNGTRVFMDYEDSDTGWTINNRAVEKALELIDSLDEKIFNSVSTASTILLTSFNHESLSLLNLSPFVKSSYNLGDFLYKYSLYVAGGLVEIRIC